MISEAERDHLRLARMREVAYQAQTFASSQTRELLEEDRLELRALEMSICLIGVSASKMSPAFRHANSQIEWAHFVEMQRHLTEEYDRVDLDRVWETATKSIPALIVELEKLLPPED